MTVENMDALYRQLAEILETDNISREDVLADYPDWDSLSALSLVSAVISKYGVTLSGEEIAKFRTAGDVEDLVAAKLAKKAACPTTR